MLKKNDDIPLRIENCSLDGNGVGHFDGMAVFVPATAEGDEITAHIIKVKKSFAVGKVKDIITPSIHRENSPCPVYLRCGGCSFGHVKYETEAAIKENHVKECFRRIGKLDPEFEPFLMPGQIYRYRNKAQFPVKIEGDDIRMGFYSSHSHRVVNCPGCLLQPPEFETILGVFEKYIRLKQITSFDEESGKGLLRHIYLRKAVKTDQIMVCPVINGKALPDEEELVKMLLEACPQIKTVVVNSNTEKTNVIMGKRCRNIYGGGYIEDILCSQTFRISPLSFYQVNHDQAEKIYRKAAEYADLTGNEILIDLYCGIGTIGLTMADKVRKLIGVEIIPDAVEDAKINAAANGTENAEFICGDAAQAARQLEERGIKPDVVLLDPPRKGCARELIETVVQMNPDRIVYISCDPATLARDCGLFDELGYKTVKVTPADLFPRTAHCETVAKLTRVEL